ncbi:MAG: helix-turn-helix domain-containing protein [Halanaerobiales bacterium]
MYINNLFNLGAENMSFGKRLRQLREENKISQIELAKKMSITSQALSQYELNKRMPDTEMVRKLAKHFKVSVDYLLGESNERSPADKIKQSISSDPELANFWDKLSQREDLQLLFKQTKDMSPEGVKQIIRIIKAIEDEEQERYNGG